MNKRISIRNIVKKDAYYDSVTLMLVSREIKKEHGIIDAAVMMGTDENLKILKSAGLFQISTEVSPNDLIIAIKGEERKIDEILSRIDSYFTKTHKRKRDILPENIQEALKILPDANLALISVAGRYAGDVAEQALNNNLNVKIFSDNVPIETELRLKKIGIEKGLFVLGPDAGTSIINGVPIAFANVVKRGNIGIVGASGTGIQETSVIISKNNAGISQALGIGSRDLSEDIGGIMAKFCLDALENDNNTDTILFISKPPAKSVAEELLNFIEKNIRKPVVVLFLGADMELFKDYNVYYSSNLFEAALKSVFISQNKSLDNFGEFINRKIELLKEKAKELKKPGKYIRGLFSGGTLCEEAMGIAMPLIGDIYSNVALKDELKIDAISGSKKHTFIDMGSDEFTVGRLHPMIDYETRMRRLLEEIKDPDVGVILMDIVLGYGANTDPASEIVPVLNNAKSLLEKEQREVLFIGYILGTDDDLQNYTYQKERLEKAGMIIPETNFESALLAGLIVER